MWKWNNLQDQTKIIKILMVTSMPIIVTMEILHTLDCLVLLEYKMKVYWNVMMNCFACVQVMTLVFIWLPGMEKLSHIFVQFFWSIFSPTPLRNSSADYCFFLPWRSKMSTTNSSNLPVQSGFSPSRFDKNFYLLFSMLPIMIAACIVWYVRREILQKPFAMEDGTVIAWYWKPVLVCLS